MVNTRPIEPTTSLIQRLRARLSWRPWRREGVLELCLGDDRLRYRSCREFGFAMASRNAVPALRTDELLRRPLDELRAEITTLRTLENQLEGVLEDGERLGIPVTSTLRALGVRMFSKDHDWRAVFRALLTLAPAREPYVRVALRHYLDYLAARREVIGLVVGLRAAHEQRAEAVTADASFAPDRATVAFDARAVELTPTKPMRRLPQGEAVRLRLECGREVDIRLARHTFSLAHGSDWTLRDGSGRHYRLREGVNSVGRSRDNDISLDAKLHNVSRRHLLAQPVGPDEIELVDLSSAGTWIPETALAS